MITKKCSKCGVEKGITEFHKGQGIGGRRSICRSCSTVVSREYRNRDPEETALKNCNSHLKANYGMTLEEYDTMLAEQDGRCAICGTDEPGGHGQRFHVDHDHITGKNRGLLCHGCNTSLGGFQDSIEVLASAINYLRRF